MALTKAFGTINHESLLPEHEADGFSKNALTLVCSYLRNGKRKVIVKHNSNKTQTAIAGVPQGSIDGPLFFDLFMSNLVLSIQFIFRPLPLRQ